MFRIIALILANALVLISGQSPVNSENSGSYKSLESIRQDWDYVTIKEGAHYFWWLYYATPIEMYLNWYDKPLLIVLSQTTFKSASGYVNFNEIGPLTLDFERRNDTLILDFNVLFIDNILGSGFSCADNETFYPKTNDEMVKDLFEVIQRFFDEHPHFRHFSTYMYTQKFGTQIAAKCALIWAQVQKNNLIQSNFKGIVLKEPWISLVDVANFWTLNYDKFDKDDSWLLDSVVNEINTSVATNNWDHAFYLFQSILVLSKKYFMTNRLMKRPDIHYKDMNRRYSNLKDLFVLMNTQVRKDLRINHNWMMNNTIGDRIIENNAMKPLNDIYERLLQETDIEVNILTSDVDMSIPWFCVEYWVNNFNWPGQVSFRNAKPKNLDDSHIYVKSYKNLRYYWIQSNAYIYGKENTEDLATILRNIAKK